MKTINYTAKILPDGHIPLPEKIKKEMGLAVNSVVRITLERDTPRENAIKAFGAWSEKSEIKGGVEYVDDIRSGWDKRTKRIDNV
ncbi:MAG: hypothetical protein U9N40_00060 [Euryarchaeota archaeon]|nr:hypothetical protein [Euryarchaeota archaeon]